MSCNNGHGRALDPVEGAEVGFADGGEIGLEACPEAVGVWVDVTFGWGGKVDTNDEEDGVRQLDICARDDTKVGWIDDVIIGGSGPE